MNEKKKKKFYGTEAKGYCPFEQASGARRWLGALGAQQAQAWRAGRAGVARGRGAGALGGMGAGALGGTGAGARGAGARGRAAWRAGGRRADGGARGARAERAGQGRLGGRRAAWALGARPGRLGWPWAVHSVHSAHFRSVLTRFFFFLSHQMNIVHCKINFSKKKKYLLNSNKNQIKSNKF